MTVTDIKIEKVDSDSRLKAYASVVLDDEVTLNKLRIVNGKNGLFISMPARKMPDGTYEDYIVLSKKLLRFVKDEVLKKYERVNK